MTNFQRIKRMRKDELADFLDAFRKCPSSGGYFCTTCQYYKLCRDGWSVAKWLSAKVMKEVSTK